jgi:hypothetical protein
MKTSAAFCVSFAILAVASSADANRLEPVPLYGAYDMHLDRSKQTLSSQMVMAVFLGKEPSQLTAQDVQGMVPENTSSHSR